MKTNQPPLAKRIPICAFAAAMLACCVALAEPAAAKRILHFPKDRSLGMLLILDAAIERKIQDFYYHVDGTGMAWEYLGEATGIVAVPPGKKLSLRLNQTSGRDLSVLEKLGADDLDQLHLAAASDGQSLSHLASLTGLKVLTFPRALAEKPGHTFTPEELKHLRPLKSLERLTAPEQIDDPGLAAIVEAVPQLRALYLLKNNLTDSGLAALSKLKALEELNIGGDKITASGLAALSDLPSLHYLSLWGNAANDNSLRAVRKIASLKTLNTPQTISDAGLAHLAGHPNLEALSLYNTKVTDRGVAHLKSLPSLKKLDLTKVDFDRAHPPITDVAIGHLKAIKTLEDLRLPADGVTDAGLADLAELSNLKSLTLPMAHSRDRTSYLNPYTEKGISELTKLRSLESLFIAGPGVTDAALAHVARLTNLQSLTLFGCPVSDEGLSRLATLRSLKSFTLMNGARITLTGINHLNALTALTTLQADITARNETHLNISALTQLESLMLSLEKGSTFNDEDLACLAQLTKLKWLQLGSTQTDITDVGIAHLANLTALDRVVLGGAGVTDRSLAVLANLPRLDLLRIGGTFTDEGLQHLENLKALQSLSIYSSNALSPAASERFRKAAPNLHRFTCDEVAATPAATASPHPKPGTPAPDFTVTTLDGEKFALSEQRGKVIMLHFWATWCSPCVASLPAHRDAHAALKKKYGDRIVLIDLAMDDADDALRNLVTHHKLTTPQARIGTRSNIATSYGVDGAPDEFLIGPDGKILLNRESPEGPDDLERVIDKALGVKEGSGKQATTD
jgi:peroxiredoxin